MDPETRLSDGETQPLNDESSPHFVDEGKEPLSTGPSRQAPDIALSFAEKPALGLGVEGLGTDVIRASNSSDTESRYILLGNQDHSLRGLTNQTDNAELRTDYPVHPAPGTPIYVTPPPTAGTAEHNTRTGGSMLSSGQHANQAGPAQQSNVDTNSAGSTLNGLPYDATTSGPGSHASGREDDSPRGARVRPRRRFMRWFRDHFNRQAPWSPFRRHDPSLVRQALREFDKIFHRR